MKRRPRLLIDTLIYVSIYGLLVLLVFVTLLGTSLFLILVPRISELAGKPAVTARTRRLAVLPTVPPGTPQRVYDLAIPAGSLQKRTATFDNTHAPVTVSHPVAHTVQVVDHSASPLLDPQAQVILAVSAALPEMGSARPVPLPSASPAKAGENTRVPPPNRVRDRHQHRDGEGRDPLAESEIERSNILFMQP